MLLLIACASKATVECIQEQLYTLKPTKEMLLWPFWNWRKVLKTDHCSSNNQRWRGWAEANARLPSRPRGTNTSQWPWSATREWTRRWTTISAVQLFRGTWSKMWNVLTPGCQNHIPSPPPSQAVSLVLKWKALATVKIVKNKTKSPFSPQSTEGTLKSK